MFILFRHLFCVFYSFLFIIMALRIFSKINRNLILNLGKVFYSGKPAASSIQDLNENSLPQTAVNDVKIPKNQLYGTHTSSTFIQQAQISSTDLMAEVEHLQPSKLNEYYKPSINVGDHSFPNLPESVWEQSKGESQYRTFEQSPTYKNIKLPLKKPRLVSPFPDPVKEMPSDTMSDQEKAELKEAEARCTKSDKIPLNFSQVRHYSSSSSAKDDKKCSISKKKKLCPTLKSPCKSPAKKKICDKDYEFEPCKKKQAPYKAYSEFCHTIPDEQPSECKMCPWKPNEHPTFKTHKKKFHTHSVNYSPRKRVFEKQQVKADHRKGWVEQGKWRKDDSNVTASTYQNDMNAIICKNPSCPPPKGKCKKPKDKNISKSKKKKNKGGKKKEKGGKSKKGKKPKGGKSKKPKKKATTLDTNRSWVTLENQESIQELPTLFNHRSIPYYLGSTKKDKGKGKERGSSGEFKKFPFRGCNVETPVKEECNRPRCKKIKIKRKRDVTDCPPDGCKKSAGIVPPSFEYLLEKSKKPKCPKISPGKCGVEEEGPCVKKRRGTTQKCPTDLLKKKRRKPPTQKNKKTQGRTTPSSSKLCKYNDSDVGKSKAMAADAYSLQKFNQPSSSVPSSFEYLLDKPRKSKCPAAETEKCRKDTDDDPCKLKRKGKTRKCPTDLLKKKRHKPAKPRKKTAGLIRPLYIAATVKQYLPSLHLKEPTPSTTDRHNNLHSTLNEPTPSTSSKPSM